MRREGPELWEEGEMDGQGGVGEMTVWMEAERQEEGLGD